MIMRSSRLLVSLAVSFVVGASGVFAQSCPGDCDGDSQVSIAELIRGVRIALRQLELSECPVFDTNADGRVAVGELVAAVRAALEVCIADTPTPTSTPTPTATPLPPQCGDGVVQFPEECDDGNVDGGDGCSDACALEPGGDVCAGIPASNTEDYRAVLVADGLASPSHVSGPPLDPNRIFVLEQGGTVWVVVRTSTGYERLAEPFLNLVDRVAFSGGVFDERGLLSIAFHPDYENNRWFFVNYNCRAVACPPGVAAGATVVSRFLRSRDDPNRAEPDSERVLLAIDQPFSNHNGGQLAFGPDGMMYIGMGDGGGGGDPRETAQRDDILLGKLLRVDVDVADAPYWRVPSNNPNPIEGELGLIWAKGLRNPWRFSFDRATGDLFIADVGQQTFEEIDFQPADSRGGENYGWDIFEADSCFEPDPAPDCPEPPERDAFVFPIHQYGRSLGASVTGGFVYRGCVLRSLDGTYLFSDFVRQGIRTLDVVNGAVTRVGEISSSIELPDGLDIRSVSSFGEDARGEIYIVDRQGEVFLLAPR